MAAAATLNPEPYLRGGGSMRDVEGSAAAVTYRMAVDGFRQDPSQQVQMQREAMAWAWEHSSQMPRQDRLPPTTSQLLTPSFAAAFGIQLMNSFRYPPPARAPLAPAAPARVAGDYHPRRDAAVGLKNEAHVGQFSGAGAPLAPAHGGARPAHPRQGGASTAAAPASSAYPSFHHAPPTAPSATPAMGGAPQHPRLPAHFGYNPSHHQQQYAPHHHYDAPPQQPPRNYHQEMFNGMRDGNPQQGVMDPSVSYEQMIAYQAGVEHSRSFEAFKRSRDEPSASLGGMEGVDDDSAQATKRPRLVWTPPLHKRFVDAVSHLGNKSAVPKTIMQLMNVDGLSRENVASHLQKYRLYLKRLRGCGESTMDNSPTREGGGSGGEGSDGALPGETDPDGSGDGSGNLSGGGSGDGDGSGAGSGAGDRCGSEGNGRGLSPTCEKANSDLSAPETRSEKGSADNGSDGGVGGGRPICLGSGSDDRRGSGGSGGDSISDGLGHGNSGASGSGSGTHIKILITDNDMPRIHLHHLGEGASRGDATDAGGSGIGRGSSGGGNSSDDGGKSGT